MGRRQQRTWPLCHQIAVLVPGRPGVRRCRGDRAAEHHAVRHRRRAGPPCGAVAASTDQGGRIVKLRVPRNLADPGSTKHAVDRLRRTRNTRRTCSAAQIPISALAVAFALALAACAGTQSTERPADEPIATGGQTGPADAERDVTVMLDW